MTYKSENIHLLTNRSECLDVKHKLNQVVDIILLKNNDWQICLRKKKNWVAVPIAPKQTFVDSIDRLLQLKISDDNQKLFGVFIDTLIDDFTAFEIQANIDGLSEFNVEPPSNYKAVFTGETDWMFITVEGDFYVLLGSVSLIEEFLNKSIDVDFNKYDEYVESWEFPEESKERLQPLKDYLRKVSISLKKYQNLPVGSQINIW